ncbi:MAG: hypothetical protein EAS48_10950 [Chryseobacterium sp.]|nr:MAG: hypothetical protein EAS48_10950 [Chryseobacterium sp.]
MKRRINRLCIYTKDVQSITGRSLRYSRNLLNEMRKELKKEKKEFLTIEEFCRYTGLRHEAVMEVLRD